MELLLAITLFCIIAVAVYSSLAVGIKVYKHGEIGGKYNDICMSLDIVARDIRNAVSFNGLYLTADSEKISFYSILPDKNEGRNICKITYSWKEEDGKYLLTRLRETYAEGLQEAHSDAEGLLSGIDKLAINYAFVKKKLSGESEIQWKDEWKESSFPKLLRLKMTIGTEKIEKVIFCPAGKMAELKEETI